MPFLILAAANAVPASTGRRCGAVIRPSGRRCPKPLPAAAHKSGDSVRLGCRPRASLQFDRNAGGAERLGNRHRLYEVVGGHVGAPAEAAAGQQRVDLDLLGL